MRPAHRSRTDSLRWRERQLKVTTRTMASHERRYRLVDAEDCADSAMTRDEAIFQMWLDENRFDR
ncbi:MAG TPA: hypothetical protein VIK11_07260 [Tepidiformaceae bacterium]